MARGTGATAIILGLLAAGCVQAPDVETASLADDATAALARVVSFDANGLLATLPTFADVEVRIADVGANGPEPSLGVLSDGTIFITASEVIAQSPTTPAGTAAVDLPTLARSKDHGMSWELVRTGDALMMPKTSLDPWMWVDPWTDRVFNAPLYVACTWATWSDDGGDTWDGNPVTGCVDGIPAHDHQKLTSGPPAEGTTTSGYDSVIYYSYNSFRGEGTWIQQSYNGGTSYTLGKPVHADSPCHSGIAGPVAVGDDGVAYSPKPTCDGIDMAVTKDSGLTWSLVSIDDVGTADALAHMTDAAVDDALNAYGTWTGEDGLPYITRTTDQGETWSKPIRASPPGVTVSVHNVITAGAAGRVAVAYLGTRADPAGWDAPHAQAADDEAVWHLFLSITEDALAEVPVWTTVQVTPEDDPVQIGAIWLSGGSGENGNRNLLDFIDMVERDGRLYIGYADGCDACASVDESKGSAATVAIMERGPSLLGGLLAPLGAVVEELAGENQARPDRLPQAQVG